MAYKSVEQKGSVTGAIEQGYSELEELASECSDASSNFPNSSHPKAEAFQEAASTLEGCTTPDLDAIEEADADGELTWHESVNRDKRKGPSRAVRASNAAAKLSAAADALRQKAEELREKETEERSSGTVADNDKADVTDGLASGLEQLADELESHASDAEGVEFPGLYG